MGKSESPYTKRLGKAKTRFGIFAAGVHQLWLGADHVLHIQRSSFSETYKRFYFGDIQAIMICRTETGALMNTFLSVATGAMLLLGFGFPVGGDRVATMAAEAALPSILLLYNLLLGPTCLCRFYTAVQCEPIRALSRLRKANKALDILRPLIEAKQGVLDETALSAIGDAGRSLALSRLGSSSLIEAKQGVLDEVALSAIGDAGRSVALSRFSSSSLGDVPIGRYEDCAYHRAYFLLLMLIGFSSMIDIVWQHPVKNAFDVLIFVAALILGIVALTRQANSSVDRQIRGITWFGLLACQAAHFAVCSIITGLMAAANPGLYTAMSGTEGVHGVWLDPAFGVFGTLGVLTGIVGFMRVLKYRARWAKMRAETAAGQPEALS